jgi:hypothetical protein
LLQARYKYRVGGNQTMKSAKFLAVPGIVLAVFLTSFIIRAQNDFAATLEVLSAGVEVQRVNTANYIPVEVEAIVGVGDYIRTDATGEARITFFDDGTDVTLEPNTEYHIVEFQGDDEDFQISVEVLAGQTLHRLNRVLGANSRYDVETPTMTLAAQGTVFAIRVEESGRAGMLVFDGTVDADSEAGTADVPPEFGIRAEAGSTLSDVVRASTFAQLDAALDGCSAAVTTLDDVSINVRLGPSLEQNQVGVLSAEMIDSFIGVSADGSWYRIRFAGGFGWLLSSTATIDSACAGLRVFENTRVEDASLYSASEESSNLLLPEATLEPEATAEAPSNSNEAGD